MHPLFSYTSCTQALLRLLIDQECRSCYLALVTSYLMYLSLLLICKFWIAIKRCSPTSAWLLPHDTRASLAVGQFRECMRVWAPLAGCMFSMIRV